MSVGKQPYLHDLVTCLAAPCVVLSGADGQIRPHAAQGVFVADVRVLSEAVVQVDGSEGEPVSCSPLNAGTAEFVTIVRTLGDPTPDPTVWLRRRRTAGVSGVAERLTLINSSFQPIATTITVRVSADLVEVERVKTGRPTVPVEAELLRESLRYSGDQLDVEVAFTGAQLYRQDGETFAQWTVAVSARSKVEVGWTVAVRDVGAVVVPASVPAGFAAPVIVADDRRLAPFVTGAVSDLLALRMSHVTHPADEFLAAGSPWYLTLFGRDSLWAARMMLPLGTDLAAGTLRTLAALQGTTVDPATDEQPGKILHELRRVSTKPTVTSLPPVYYGTVDATLLWVCLLADAWRWGMPPDQVRALIPSAERALVWMADYGDADGDGFLDYHDEFGRGLTNQGWKDSDDSVRFADGTVAVGPVALAEVQGYAYEAAMAGAALLDGFDRPGADRWRRFAAEMAERFRASFWVRDSLGPFPALALDGNKRPVDAPASNMGHLLATGILSETEAKIVADRLVHPSMSSGFGLRTMASTAGGYSPLSYHCGSVWPHDTAIAVQGLITSGFREHATQLGKGLLAAGDAFGARVPELFGGFAADDLPVPVPYPAACRPQAWAAAGALVMVRAFLGLEPDVPAGVVRLRPSAAVGALDVSGLRVGGKPFAMSVDSGGNVTSVVLAPGLSIDVALTL